MKLKIVTVHETKGSFLAYIPKAWAKEMDLKQGDKVSWSIPEGDHETLQLKKVKVDNNGIH